MFRTNWRTERSVDAPQSIARVDLDGTWTIVADPEVRGEELGWREGEPESAAWRFQQEVPSCWNSLPGLDRYEGVAWYFRKFDLPPDDRLSGDDDDAAGEWVLAFGGVNYACDVWLNGRSLGSHEGGFLPFSFPVARAFLKPEGNSLVVRVDGGRRAGGVPGLATDWFNWCGIHRHVELNFLPTPRFDRVRVVTEVPARDRALVRVRFVQTSPFPFSWEVRLGHEVVAEGKWEGEESPQATTAGGQFSFALESPRLWSPEEPALHMLSLRGHGVACDVRFGVREIEARGVGVYLNRRRVVLRGASLHEELVPHGRSYHPEERRADVRAMKALGFNALRTAHYSHDDSLLDACDEEGMLVLEEIPLYWDCDFKSPRTFKLAAAMVRDLVERDANHPCVVLWSMGNEIPVERPECSRFIVRLMDWARRLDQTRLVSYVSCRFWSDLARRRADVTCLNGYLGWYYPTEKQLDVAVEGAYQSNPGVPLLYTEFGAGAKVGHHHPNPGTFLDGRFSEERQAALLAHSIRTLNSKPQVAGWFIWVYRDFRSHMRNNQFQQGFNRKGLVSERNEPKLAARVMPRLVSQAYRDPARFRPVFSAFVALLQKLLFPLAYLVACVVGAASPLFTHASAGRYYVKEPEPEKRGGEKITPP
ncbi:MAG: beta-glucuronidase [Promethearchaeota archaeon]